MKLAQVALITLAAGGSIHVVLNDGMKVLDQRSIDCFFFFACILFLALSNFIVLKAIRRTTPLKVAFIIFTGLNFSRFITYLAPSRHESIWDILLLVIAPLTFAVLGWQDELFGVDPAAR